MPITAAKKYAGRFYHSHAFDIDPVNPLLGFDELPQGNTWLS